VTASVNHAALEVFLEVDGVRLDPADSVWPYHFASLEFADGEYSVSAVAVGADDVERASKPVLVQVGETAPVGSSTGEDGTGDGRR